MFDAVFAFKKSLLVFNIFLCGFHGGDLFVGPDICLLFDIPHGGFALGPCWPARCFCAVVEKNKYHFRRKPKVIVNTEKTAHVMPGELFAEKLFAFAQNGTVAAVIPETGVNFSGGIYRKLVGRLEDRRFRICAGILLLTRKFLPCGDSRAGYRREFGAEHSVQFLCSGINLRARHTEVTGGLFKIRASGQRHPEMQQRTVTVMCKNQCLGIGTGYQVVVYLIIHGV